MIRGAQACELSDWQDPSTAQLPVFRLFTVPILASNHAFPSCFRYQFQRVGVRSVSLNSLGVS